MVFAAQRVLVATLITSVWETLKVEGSSWVAEDVAVPFGTHKPSLAAKVFPYPTYFDKFLKINLLEKRQQKHKQTFTVRDLAEVSYMSIC